MFYNGSEEEGRKKYKALFDIGPIVDQASEVPYENVNSMTVCLSALLVCIITNSISQNPLADWGLNYYFKGVLLGDMPSRDLNRKTFDRVLEIASSKDHLTAILLEFLPHGKINSVPANATPYRRDLPGNTLILCQWKNGTPEMNQKAKEMCHAIAEILPKGEGYGNYSEW